MCKSETDREIAVKALACLMLELPESVHRDFKQKFDDAVTEIKRDSFEDGYTAGRAAGVARDDGE